MLVERGLGGRRRTHRGRTRCRSDRRIGQRADRLAARTHRRIRDAARRRLLRGWPTRAHRDDVAARARHPGPQPRRRLPDLVSMATRSRIRSRRPLHQPRRHLGRVPAAPQSEDRKRYRAPWWDRRLVARRLWTTSMPRGVPTQLITRPLPLRGLGTAQATALASTPLGLRLLVMSRPGVRVPVPALSLVTSHDVTNYDAHVARGVSTALVEQITRSTLPSCDATNRRRFVRALDDSPVRYQVVTCDADHRQREQLSRDEQLGSRVAVGSDDLIDGDSLAVGGAHRALEGLGALDLEVDDRRGDLCWGGQDGGVLRAAVALGPVGLVVADDEERAAGGDGLAARVR